jgi:DNA-binding PadR family transcriptional regulator
MPRENKTKYAILGLIANRPMTGYDIKKRFEEHLGKFWNESYGQIYPILKELNEEGLATRKVEQAKGRPVRNVVAITEKGLQELRTWLVKPTDPHKERLEILLKLTSGAQMPIESSIRLVREFREEWIRQMNGYGIIEKDLRLEFEGQPQFPYIEMAVDCGMHVGSAYIDWCDKTIERLQGMKESALGKPSEKRDV